MPVLIIALVLLFVAFRFLAGIIKVAAIALIVVALGGLFFYLRQHGLG